MGMTGYYLRIAPQELAALERAPETVAAVVFNQHIPDDDPRRLDIDKAWHAIHHLLSFGHSADHELYDAVLGGEPIGDDLSVGPARAFGVAEVAAMATVLRSVSADELRGRWDAQELTENGIYPLIWDEGDEAMDYVLGHYAQLVTYFEAASGHGDAVLTWIL